MRIEDFMKINKCKESLIDISVIWLKLFANCVNFEQVKTDSDIIVIESLFNEDMILPKDMETIKHTVSEHTVESLYEKHH